MNKASLKILLLLNLLIVFKQEGNAQLKSAYGQWKSAQTLEHLKSAPVSLIPYPRKVDWLPGFWKINKTVSVVSDAADSNALRSLEDILSSKGISLQKGVSAPGLNNKIHLLIKKEMPISEEGYVLKVTAGGLLIMARDAAGLYYGVQTFRQLLLKNKNIFTVPLCQITDWPAFKLRGFMHDNGRNFQSIESLKRQLEILSHYKFNTFHWHLTDNPAWRPESKIFPQLNDPKNRKAGRDPEKSYRFEEIRDLIRYAKQRNINVIPELDMPGHSAFFEPAFGFKMESEKGMQVLEQLIDEFCREIPASYSPVIHIGSDEVHVPDPRGFIQRMTARVLANGRKVMVWNPGLPPEAGTIQQVWQEGGTQILKNAPDLPYVDSYAGYLNSDDALSLIQRYFFQQICQQPEGDAMALGGILCCWPDTRVDDKEKIFLHNPVWPGAITYSEAVWTGRPDDHGDYMNALPSNDTEAGKYFREFEKRLANHRDRFFQNIPFPYVQFGNVEWQMKSKGSISKKVTGGVLRIGSLQDSKTSGKDTLGMVELKSFVFSKEVKTIHAMIGFEVAERSNRRSSGIPPNGKWDANGGAVYLNGKELPGPKWDNPGGNRYLKPTWHSEANEIPFTDEEFFWSRKPASMKLKAGWNEVLVKVPRCYKDQNWMFAFIPVSLNDGGRWVEDLSCSFRPFASQI